MRPGRASDRAPERPRTISSLMSRHEPLPPRETPKLSGSSRIHGAISAEETLVPATSSQLDADLLERLRLLDVAYRTPQEWLERSGHLWFEASAWIGAAALCWAL